MKKTKLKPVWRKIVGWKNYSVSQNGLIRNDITGIIKKPSLNLYGYHRVILYEGRRRFRTMVHRLVAQAFISNPYKKPCVNHKDSNRLNNHVQNLEWVTYQENMDHAISKKGKWVSGSGNGSSVLTQKQVDEIKEYILDIDLNKRNMKQAISKHFAKLFNVTSMTIYYILTNQTWISPLPRKDKKK